MNSVYYTYGKQQSTFSTSRRDQGKNPHRKKKRPVGPFSFS